MSIVLVGGGTVRLGVPGRIARGFREGRNTCPDHTEGRQSWQEFVAAS